MAGDCTRKFLLFIFNLFSQTVHEETWSVHTCYKLIPI